MFGKRDLAAAPKAKAPPPAEAKVVEFRPEPKPAAPPAAAAAKAPEPPPTAPEAPREVDERLGQI